jgi:hypothetical protein
MSLERCCCVFATKKLGLTPLKAIAPTAIANGIFVKRKNTSRVGGYLCDGTKSRSVSDPNGIPLNGIALFGFGTFLVEPTTQPLFQAPAGRKLGGSAHVGRLSQLGRDFCASHSVEPGRAALDQFHPLDWSSIKIS